MILHGESAIGLLDLIDLDVPGNPQDLVIVSLRHRFFLSSHAAYVSLVLRQAFARTGSCPNRNRG
jgi:hypothetical protein